MRAAQESGRTVGGDLLIATRYDGLRARTSRPPLTAVDLGLEAISSAAVEMLVVVLDEGHSSNAGAAADGRDTESAAADGRDPEPATADASVAAAPAGSSGPVLVVRESTAGVSPDRGRD
ncbi:substrate-binding domain-containing protein [Brevibacterium siliguriense]|uniref:substrate-binding domain-containing protein n=1 Tax=Brevibacterium siliguriense TaxID=1136497 RepID=UPI000AE937A5|nr:substrate-binding domain-containing protein [Brevibacterium siliguriense]